MKATFEFSLPEDTEEYEMYRRAPEFLGALREFRHWLRQRTKQGVEVHLAEVWDEFQEACEGFANEL